MYGKFKLMKNACVRLKRLSENDFLNPSAISEILPNKTHKAVANTGCDRVLPNRQGGGYPTKTTS